MEYTLTSKRLQRIALVLSLIVGSLLPATTHADEGGVDLASGGRINGEIMVVMPGDHVGVRLADGTVVWVSWADITRVNDGTRIYDASGQVLSAPAPVQRPAPVVVAPPPIDDAPPLFRRQPQGQDNLRLLVAYESLPGRGGTAMLFAGGSLFALNGFGMVLSGALVGCYDYDDYYDDYDSGECGFRKGMILGGTLSLTIGAVMFWRGVRRNRERSRVIREILQGAPIARTDDTLDVAFDAHIDGQSFVPRLTLSF